MTDEQDEAPLDPRLMDLAKRYREPPMLDAGALWKKIDASRRPAVDRRKARGSRRPVMSSRAAAWITGIAALLVVGIGIGRLTAPTPSSVAVPAVVSSGSDRVASAALEVAAARHLSQAEAYLTLFQASVRSGRADSLPVATARELLATNRLLLDSPVANARLRPLLLDLELVLAEITQLGVSGRQADVQFITDGLDHGDVMMRLRAVPARGSLPIGVL
jgi:hypothetical protein